jgi:long-chain acyl-CoA synthetase
VKMQSVFAQDRLDKALQIARQEHADGTALRSDENVRYRGLWELSVDTQIRLADNSEIKLNEPILVETRNQPVTVALFAWVWLAGGVVVPVHHSSTRDNLNSLIRRTGARRMLRSNGDIVKLAEAAPPHRPLLQEAAVVVFTSGSTGQPKGVVLGHKALIGKMEAINQILRFSNHTAMLVPLQLNFIFGIWATFLPLLVGGSVRLLEKFDPTGVAALPARERITDLVLVPTMLRRLLGQSGLRPTPLRAISGGEPLSDGVAQSAREKWTASGVVDAWESSKKSPR